MSIGNIDEDVRRRLAADGPLDPADFAVIASWWHGGQGSVLYSLASTGELHYPVHAYQAEITQDCLQAALPPPPPRRGPHRARRALRLHERPGPARPGRRAVSRTAEQLRDGDTVEVNGRTYDLTHVHAEPDGVWADVWVGGLGLDLPMRFDFGQLVATPTPEAGEVAAASSSNP